MSENLWAENEDVSVMVIGELQFVSALIEDPISSGVIDPTSNVTGNPTEKRSTIDPR